jgi:hypothetical protein
MKMSDMRAKARAIFGPAIAEPMPNQPNGAKALQERANARPIPTYKVGGAVKKTPPGPTPAELAESKRFRESIAKIKPTKEQGETLNKTGRYKNGGGVHTSADTAKKLATEMGGMKKGGAAKKDGLAVMIALGGPKKGMMDGGEIPTDMRSSKLMAAGGAGKTRKGQAPVKKAQGGAGKVRKGMMTPEGQITHAMNKLRGK